MYRTRLHARAVIVLLLPLLLSACATHTVRPTKMDAYALQELQTRDIEAPYKVVYASVLSVLQDAGYIVESADGESGLITAKSPTDSKLKYNLFWGFGKRNTTTRVTAFVEPISSDFSKVRLNFVAIQNDRHLYGIASQVDTPIENADIYRNVFEKIEEAVFVRMTTNTQS